DGALREAEALELGTQATDLLIDVRDLPGILREGKAKIADAGQPVREVAPVRQAAARHGGELLEPAPELWIRLVPVEVSGEPVGVENQLPNGAAVDAELALERAHEVGPGREAWPDSVEFVEVPVENHPVHARLVRVEGVALVIGPVEGRWGRVRHVGVEVVHPHEDRVPARSPEPAEEPTVRLASGERLRAAGRRLVDLEVRHQGPEPAAGTEVPCA